MANIENPGRLADAANLVAESEQFIRWCESENEHSAPTKLREFAEWVEEEGE